MKILCMYILYNISRFSKLNGRRITRDRDPKLIKTSHPIEASPGFAKGTSYIKVRSLEKVLVHKPILP